MARWDDCPWLEPFFLSPVAAGRYLILSLSPEAVLELLTAGQRPAWTQLGSCTV